MKTSVDIYDPLYEEARIEFPTMTIKQIVNQGVRVLLDTRVPKQHGKGKLQRVVVTGRGLQEGVEWSALRDLAYERE